MAKGPVAAGSGKEGGRSPQTEHRMLDSKNHPWDGTMAGGCHCDGTQGKRWNQSRTACECTYTIHSDKYTAVFGMLIMTGWGWGGYKGSMGTLSSPLNFSVDLKLPWGVSSGENRLQGTREEGHLRTLTRELHGMSVVVKTRYSGPRCRDVIDLVSEKSLGGKRSHVAIGKLVRSRENSKSEDCKPRFWMTRGN